VYRKKILIIVLYTVKIRNEKRAKKIMSAVGMFRSISFAWITNFITRRTKTLNVIVDNIRIESIALV